MHCLKLVIRSVLTLRLKKKDAYDQIMQGWLIPTKMEVDKKELPKPKTEKANANIETQLSIKFLEKLGVNMEKLDANVEMLMWRS